ncbi:McrB family protein [Pseudomonas soli]|uniref:McrB family protein n=1 Tax=Pseudomonas soli TaxID=1306993 RepID=UPI0028B24796|nr:AAA family ATPase [Pseudomonas soli]
MRLSSDPVRRSTPEALGVLRPDTPGTPQSALSQSSKTENLPTLPADNDLLLKTIALREDGFAGVILSGPPGTSKSWCARRLAFTLAEGNIERVRFVQFHPSYQYEDFIESYEPTENGGFSPKPRVFLNICELAISSPNSSFILVIDELSRCDAVRVFGEALTYLEVSQRDIEFELASGRRVQIPANLFIIATMNPWDRGVDELDMAFERRFAKIAMDPDEGKLKEILLENRLSEPYLGRVLNFFRYTQRHHNTYAKIGHAYFSRVKNPESLRRLWEFQLRFHFEKTFRHNMQDFEHVSELWERIFRGESNTRAVESSDGPRDDAVQV